MLRVGRGGEMKKEGRRGVLYAVAAMAIGLVAGGAFRGPSLEARTNVLEQQALRLGGQFSGDEEQKPPEKTPQDLETRIDDLERAVRSLDRDLRWTKIDLRHLQARVSSLESRIRSKTEEP